MVLSKSTNTEPFYKCGARCFKKIGFAVIFDALVFIVIMFSRWYSIPEEEAYRRYLQNLSWNKEEMNSISSKTRKRSVRIWKDARTNWDKIISSSTETDEKRKSDQNKRSFL